MQLKDGQNIEELLIGRLKPASTLNERAYHSLTYEAGIKTVREEIRSKALSNKHLTAREQIEIIDSGLRVIRAQLANNYDFLDKKMQAARQGQAETNPSNPQRTFPKNLLSDLDEKMGVLDVQDGEKYDLRFYIASGTILDFAGSFDCWVELYDLEKGKSVADVKIDIKTKPGANPHNLADIVYYFDSNKYLKEYDKVDMGYRQDAEYSGMLREAASILMRRAKITRPS